MRVCDSAFGILNPASGMPHSESRILHYRSASRISHYYPHSHFAFTFRIHRASGQTCHCRRHDTVVFPTGYLSRVIKSPGPVEQLRIREERVAYDHLSYEGAVDIYLALWSEAQLLNPNLGDDWLDDVQCDIAIARTLNGIAPAI
jgi:hypothetical protein